MLRLSAEGTETFGAATVSEVRETLAAQDIDHVFLGRLDINARLAAGRYETS